MHFPLSGESWYVKIDCPYCTVLHNVLYLIHDCAPGDPHAGVGGVVALARPLTISVQAVRVGHRLFLTEQESFRQILNMVDSFSSLNRKVYVKYIVNSFSSLNRKFLVNYMVDSFSSLNRKVSVKYMVDSFFSLERKISMYDILKKSFRQS